MGTQIRMSETEGRKFMETIGRPFLTKQELHQICCEAVADELVRAVKDEIIKEEKADGLQAV